MTSKGARGFYLLQLVKATKSRVWVRIGDADTISLQAAGPAARATAGDIARDISPNEEARKVAAKRRAERLQQAQAADEPTVDELVRRYRNEWLDRLSPRTAAGEAQAAASDGA